MSLSRLKSQFLQVILPTWAAVGYDKRCGQFVEHLELDGQRKPPERFGRERLHGRSMCMRMRPISALHRPLHFKWLRQRLPIFTASPGLAAGVAAMLEPSTAIPKE